MAEETQTTETQTETEEQTTVLGEQTQETQETTEQTKQDTVLSQQVSPIKADGTFIEGWRDTLPEEIRGEECLTLVKDFPEMVKQFVNQRKAIGKNKVAVPTDKSDENEWNSFYEAIGRPKTHTGYIVPEIPEDLKEIFSDERISRAKERAHKLGATQKQFQDYLTGELEEVSLILQNEDEIDAKAKREARLNVEKELRAEFGAAYDERMHVANRIITEAIPKEQDRLEFIEQYGNDVKIIRLLSTIGARMSEHTALIAELTQKTPTEIEQKIKKLEGDPRYRNINSDMSEEERQQITEELRELYKQRYPEKKTG